MGFALGFFPKNLRDEMKLIGQIRNKLAHSALEIKFSDDLIQTKCLELKKFDGKIIGETDDHLDEKDPMKIYTMSCFIVMTVLLMLGQ